jgi:hypothetical protein
MKDIPESVFWLLIVLLICATIFGVVIGACHYHNQKVEIMTRAGYSLKSIPINYQVEWVKEEPSK